MIIYIPLFFCERSACNCPLSGAISHSLVSYTESAFTLLWVHHCSDVIMTTMAHQIAGVSIVYSTVCLGADQSKYQSSAPLAFVCGIHRWPVNSPHKRPVTRKIFQFDITSSCIYIILERKKSEMISQCHTVNFLSWFNSQNTPQSPPYVLILRHITHALPVVLCAMSCWVVGRVLSEADGIISSSTQRCDEYMVNIIVVGDPAFCVARSSATIILTM